MVVTPHWGAHSLSLDLSSDKISATGSCQSFAHVTAVHFCESKTMKKWNTAIAKFSVFIKQILCIQAKNLLLFLLRQSQLAESFQLL